MYHSAIQKDFQDFSEEFSRPYYVNWNGSSLVISQDNVTGRLAQREPANIAPFLFHAIPINEADLDLLVTISGIGPRLGGEIIKTRKQSGPYNSAEDLLQVRGIGQKRMLQFKKHFSFN